MRKILVCLLWTFIPLAAVADHHDTVAAEVRAKAEAFNTAYATNDADSYFGFYTPDAQLFFYGSRQPVAAYSKEWRAAIAAGGGAAKNEMSDLNIQVLAPGIAVATYFVDNETRSPDGEVASAKAFETDVWQKIHGEWRIVSLHYTEI